MSSSGVIYAIIVGAWAVYLVPMWLRREDELNRARQTQKYAAAIKVLAHKEAFERRWAQPDEAESAQALPRAVGQNIGPALRAPWHPRAADAPVTPAAETTMAVPLVTTSTAKVTAAAKVAGTATAAAAATKPAAKRTVAPAASTSAKQQVTATVRPAPAFKDPGSRTGLMAIRRRVVGILFTATTLGALVSADLGVQFLWAMAIPAVLLSAYIVRLRSDERLRAAARARRRAAAQEAREAREARDRENAQLQAARAADAARLAAELAEAEARAEAEEQRRSQATRRRSAAARSRAQAYTQAQESPDLPRASNG
jgi:hypothetical protein